MKHRLRYDKLAENSMLHNVTGYNVKQNMTEHNRVGTE